MKRIIESILSVIIFIIGIFLLVYLLYKSYFYEALEYGVGLSLVAFIISPLSDLLFKGELKVIDKVILIIYEYGIYYVMRYLLNLNYGVKFLGLGVLFYSKTKIIISFIINIVLLLVLFFVLKIINHKNKQKLKILLMILVLLPYVVSKSLLMYQYNKITKNITIMNAEPIVIKKKEAKNKYYFENNVYSENFFEGFERHDFVNKYALKNSNGTKWILHSLDYSFGNYYNEQSKKLVLENKIVGFNRYIIKNIIDTDFKAYEIYRKNPKMDIWDFSNDFYYQYLILYCWNDNENDKINYYFIEDENGKEYYIINSIFEQDDPKINRYLSITSFDDQVYYWSFIGDYTLDDIYDFISTLNIEKNK